jgi:hypothetical protein
MNAGVLIRAVVLIGLWGGQAAADGGVRPPATRAGLSGAERRKVAELLDRLGEADFRSREAAQTELEEFCKPLGARALPMLMDARRGPDVEVSARCGEAVRSMMSAAPLPDLLAGADRNLTRQTLGVVLDGRTDRRAAEWFAGSDPDFPPGMRLTAAGMLVAFLEGNPETAVRHCAFPFVRHGEPPVDRDQLLDLWRRLSPNWPSHFGSLSRVEAFRPGRLPAGVNPMFDMTDRDRGIVFHYSESDEDLGVKLVFVLRPEASGRWRVVALAQ